MGVPGQLGAWVLNKAYGKIYQYIPIDLGRCQARMVKELIVIMSALFHLCAYYSTSIKLLQ